MTNIEKTTVYCPCGREFEARLYRSVNPDLSPDAIDDFLQFKLNRPECPACGKTIWVDHPVLFNDMARGFMVWVGNTGELEGYLDEEEKDDAAPVVYADNYIAAITALAVFRGDPANAVPRGERPGVEQSRAYAKTYEQLYQEAIKALEESCN
jgi:hypothetical protein